MVVNPTIAAAVLGLVGVIATALITSRVTKAKNQADTSGALLNTVITRLESVEDDLESAKSQVSTLTDELREVKDRYSQVTEDFRRQQRISEEMGNYALVLIKHIETGKPPPPPEVPWTLRPYFDQEAT